MTRKDIILTCYEHGCVLVKETNTRILKKMYDEGLLLKALSHKKRRPAYILTKNGYLILDQLIGDSKFKDDAGTKNTSAVVEAKRLLRKILRSGLSPNQLSRLGKKVSYIDLQKRLGGVF